MDLHVTDVVQILLQTEVVVLIVLVEFTLINEV